MSDTRPGLSWGHININVSDLDRAVDFYGKLGFELFMPAIPYLALDMTRPGKPLPDEAAHALGVAPGTIGRACIMQLGNGFPKIDLTELSSDKSRAPLSNSDLGLARICLGSQDLSADVARLKAAGVEFLSGPTPGHKGLADIAVCKDPDGTLIELIQIYPERWQALLNPG